MIKEKINLEEVAALTKELFHEHYAGNPERWFAYLCPDSVYLGTGDPILFGGDVIREHFKDSVGKRLNIVQDEYFSFALSDQTTQVCGQITIENKRKKFRVIQRFTMIWRIIDRELKIIHQHNSYEYMLSEKSSRLNLDANSMQFVRNLLLKGPAKRRISIRSGTQTVFVDPYTVLYVQSRRNRTELVCTDRVISCNSPIGTLSKELPEIFYPLRRGYLVNTLYVVAIRRFEAVLISDISIPIPALRYQQIKQDLQELINEK